MTLDSYSDLLSVEYVSLALLLFYASNFVRGSLRNAKIVHALGKRYGKLLQSNFASLSSQNGGESDIVDFEKESQSEYRLYASGRRYCLGIAIGIQLKRRHDILSWFNQDHDMITLEVVMREDAMDPCAFALLRKSQAKRILTASPELTRLCRVVPLEFLPRKLACFTDCDELVTKILEPSVVETLRQSVSFIEGLQFSDQHKTIVLGTTAKQRKTIKCCFRLPKLKELDRLDPLLELTIRLIDVVGSTKLSPSTIQKALEVRKGKPRERRRMSPERLHAKLKQSSNFIRSKTEDHVHTD